MTQVPITELNERMERFRGCMDAENQNWELAAIFGRVNQYYFTGTMQDGVLLIPRDGPETMYEMFCILDNFNVPLGAAEGTEHQDDVSKMRSSTIWTSVYDTRNKVVYYHTQHNRRVRKVDVGKIDFETLAGVDAVVLAFGPENQAHLARMRHHDPSGHAGQLAIQIAVAACGLETDRRRPLDSPEPVQHLGPVPANRLTLHFPPVLIQKTIGRTAVVNIHFIYLDCLLSLGPED
jgi:hypothetical protein